MDNQMEKRLLLAIVLSTLVLAVFGYFLDRQRPPVPQAPTVVSPPSPSPAPPSTPAVAPTPAPSQLLATSGHKVQMLIESPLYRAGVSSTGAALTNWRLAHYKADLQPSPTTGAMVADINFEMIPQFLPPGGIRPLFIATGDPPLDREINSQNYQIKLNGGSPLSEDTRVRAPATVSLVFQRPGLYVEKTYHFRRENYIVDVKPRLVVDGKERSCSLIMGPSIGDHLPLSSDPRRIPQAVVRYANKSVDRKLGEKLDKEYTYSDAHDFAGVEIQYFASVFLPKARGQVRLQKFYYVDPVRPNKEAIKDLVIAALPAGDTPIAVFIGPKEYDTLHKINPNLTGLIDYGWFAPIAYGLLYVLKTTYQYVHNYGVAIIILTLVITLVLFPLRYKQLVSMKRMQKLQPKVKAIQEKYSKQKTASPQQRQDMQKEIMGVYSQHKVNPLGGCLPMLPQLPIFFAFNTLLAASIELRNAPFVWWIKDLSDKDPFYVTPILLGLSMVVQQKMTPSTSGDPMQDKIMLLMPVFLTFLFANLSSGLTLYFLFSNIFGIIIQKASDRWIPNPPEQESGKPLKSSVVRR